MAPSRSCRTARASRSSSTSPPSFRPHRSLPLDIALLEVNVAGREVFRVADARLARGVPFVFATGYGAQTVRPDLLHNLLLHKPVGAAESRRGLEEAIALHRA